MKGRILAVARRVFGEYGFHGTTMRMIAHEVSIDISTLHYHWGEKKDLYEAVIIDINNDLREKLIEVEGVIHGLPRGERVAISLDMMTDYLFDHPEISNLILFRYIAKTRHDVTLDFRVPEFTRDIVHSMGLPEDKDNVGQSMISIITVMNSLHNFISGEEFFRPMVKVSRDKYKHLVKETLQNMFVAVFAENGEERK